MAGIAASHTQALSRNLDKVFEDAQLTGNLSLHGRNLREFPSSSAKFQLSDTVTADLARNRLTDLPVQICDYGSMETLYLYHNCIRYIPDSAQFLDSLTYLDLGRNQLTWLPSSLCTLPLEVLLVGHNRLEHLPPEINQLADTLMELDVSCNRLSTLPSSLGDLQSLRVLNSRENLLSDLPFESVCRLKLEYLDVSSNRLTVLPGEIRSMVTLVDLVVANNPLVSPPAKVCTRGRVHIFKWLEVELSRKTKRRGVTDLDWPPSRAASLNRNARFGPGGIEENGSRAKSAVPKRRDRGSRYNTVGAESGYGSMVEENNRLSKDLSQYSGAPPPNDTYHKSVSVVGMRRSPPVGEEAPPPPPLDLPKPKVESSIPTKNTIPPAHPMTTSLPPAAFLHSNGNVSPRKPERKFIPPPNIENSIAGPGKLQAPLPSGSFFEEVMSALNNSNTTRQRTSINSGSSAEEGSPTPKATPNKPDHHSFPYPHPHDPAISPRRTLPLNPPTKPHAPPATPTYVPSTPSRNSYADDKTIKSNSSSSSHTSSSGIGGGGVRLSTSSSNGIFSPSATSGGGNPANPGRATATSSEIQKLYTKSPSRELPHRVIPQPPPTAVPLSSTASDANTSVETTPTQKSINTVGKRNSTSEEGSINTKIVTPASTAPNSISSGSTVAKQPAQPPVLPPAPLISETKKTECPKPNSASVVTPLILNGETNSEKDLNGSRTDSESPDGPDSGFSETQISTIKKQPPLPSTCTQISTIKKQPPLPSTSTSTATATTIPGGGAIKKEKSSSTITNGTTKKDCNAKRSLTTSLQNSKPSSLNPPKSGVVKKTSNSPPVSVNGKASPLSSSQSSISSSNSSNIPARNKKSSLNKTTASNRPSRAPPEPPKADKAVTKVTNGSRVPRDSLSTAHSMGIRKATDPHTQHVQIENMKKALESRLGISLPDDRIELAQEMSDGVHLCNFVNHLRARAIPSVHSTSPNVPTLTLPKCRRNVENFIMACRRLGVPESQLCSQGDLLDRKLLPPVAKTVLALLKQTGNAGSRSPLMPSRSKSEHQALASRGNKNMNINNNNNNNNLLHTRSESGSPKFSLPRLQEDPPPKRPGLSSSQTSPAKVSQV